MRTPKNAPETAYERMVREGQIAPPSRRQQIAASLSVPDPERLESVGQEVLSFHDVLSICDAEARERMERAA